VGGGWRWLTGGVQEGAGGGVDEGGGGGLGVNYCKHT